MPGRTGVPRGRASLSQRTFPPPGTWGPPSRRRGGCPVPRPGRRRPGTTIRCPGERRARKPEKPIGVAREIPTHARALYREKLDTGLAPRTVNYIHTTFSKALKDAVADGLITRNPASSVKAPRPKKKEIRPLSSEQAKVFLEAVRGDRFEAAFVVALHCGLREGEILGLKWSDVDLDAGTLQVRRTLSEALAGHLFEPPKNGKGRSVKLTARAVEALRNHLTRQIE